MNIIKSAEGLTTPKANQIGVFWPDPNYTDIYEGCCLAELQDKFANEEVQPDFYVGEATNTMVARSLLHLSLRHYRVRKTNGKRTGQ